MARSIPALRAALAPTRVALLPLATVVVTNVRSRVLRDACMLDPIRVKTGDSGSRQCAHIAPAFVLAGSALGVGPWPFRLSGGLQLSPTLGARGPLVLVYCA